MSVRGPIKYGGLNTKTSADILSATPVGNWMDVPLGQMTVCKDFNRIYGALIPRPATSIFSSQLGAATRIFGLTSWVDAANYSQSKIIFAVASDNKLYSRAWAYNTTGQPFTDVTGTATIATGVYYQFAVLNNILCGFGGSASTGIPFQVTAYNGTASNLPGNPPKGDAVKVVNNFMFVARQLNSSSTFSRISWCNVVDPTTWTAANFIDFRKNDGDRVVTLGAIGTDLYIFKFNSIGRLSTSTITASGAVSLGPLETVSTNIGAYGPNCVDNLPDGRIVFLGSDSRLYVFDGFTLNTLSDIPYPGLNVNQSLYDLTGVTTTGVGILVYPSRNQIIIYAGTTGITRVYAYDYSEHFWSEWSSLRPSIMALVPAYDFSQPASGYFALPYSLIEGTGSTGKIVQLDNNSVLTGSGSDIDALAGTATCTINVPLTGEFYDFIPRSLILPIGNGATTVTGSNNGLIVTFGWDGTLLSSNAFTMNNAQVYPNMLVIPIPYAKEGTTTVKPLSLQIKIQNTNGVMLHPFYLSDEILN